MKQKLRMKGALILLLAAFSTTSVFAQNLYSSEEDLNSVFNNTVPSELPTPGVAGPPASGMPGGDVGEPIGEGILLLTVLSGGYALFKRKRSKGLK